MAEWRDPIAARAAVVAWVSQSVAEADREGHTVLVAEDGAELVGLVSVGERRHFTGAIDGYIGELVVAERSVRRGIGSALVAAVEGWARERGLRYLTLETGAASTGARAFYSALGFAEEDIRLTKPLPPR